MSWIIPIIVGTVGAVIGYLLGKSHDKDDLEHLRISNEALRKKLDNHKLVIAEQREAVRAVSIEDVQEHEAYQTLLNKLNETEITLAKRVTELEQNNSPSNEEIENHSHYQALLAKHQQTLEQLKQEQTKQPDKLTIEVVESHRHYQTLQKQYTELQRLFKKNDTETFDAKLAKSVFGKKIKKDDLTIVDGIGAKIEQLFKVAGVESWQDLADTSIDKCYDILKGGGTHFTMHNPKTWPEQAQFAANNQWQELLDWQNTHKK